MDFLKNYTCINNLFVYDPLSLSPFDKLKKQICNSLVTADHGDQKNGNEKMYAILFYHVFY
jgi:hypothetical protein